MPQTLRCSAGLSVHRASSRASDLILCKHHGQDGLLREQQVGPSAPSFVIAQLEGKHSTAPGKLDSSFYKGLEGPEAFPVASYKLKWTHHLATGMLLLLILLHLCYHVCMSPWDTQGLKLKWPRMVCVHMCMCVLWVK